MGAGSVHDATAENETRTLSFHHTHSGEDLTITFKRDGRYDEEALKQLNHFLRDWRTQDQTVMDRHLFDIIWEVYRDVDGKKPIQIVSAYRCPATNAMLHRRSSAVARFSQHMLGHAMDLYIPDVPLEQIRFAGLRLQRGGVGFYPMSGSPFVHLDTGNIRHWPRMTHDQLAKLFPDGRTVYIPSDGVPLKGFELARADIEKRGNGDDGATGSKPSFLAALFSGKSQEDDEEATNSVADDETPVAPANATEVAAKPAPRGKLQIAAALQLASADSQLVQLPKAMLVPVAKEPAADNADTRPQTMADIINARGFWGDNPGTPKQATPEQAVAAISARQALEAADPKSSGGVPAVYQAMAFAPPANSPVDHANIVAASAAIPHSVRVAASRNLAAATEINTVAARGPQDLSEQNLGEQNLGEQNLGETVATTRIAAATGNDTWLRIMMLAPSASTMSVTMFGDADLTLMRAFFVKPRAAIAMAFTDDPTSGLSFDRFSGSATAKLQMTSFTIGTALTH
ncbi:MAG: DUF882 domain-containing protein [Bradyrhizobium sp.]